MSEGGGAERPLPVVEIFLHPDHQLPGGFDLEKVRGTGEGAVREVLGLARDGAPLIGLEEVEVTLVNDPVIADVHLEFMDIEGPTDVITFDHGEILISTETALVQAAENHNSHEEEVALYLIHGLLHLAGYADKSEEEFAEMARVQDAVLGRAWSS